MDQTVIKIDGMSCGGCVNSVTSALQELPGVALAQVSLEAGEARVSYDPARVGVEELRQAIVNAGFEAA